MTRRPDPARELLDAETWEVPFQLSADDLYLQAGADRRVPGLPLEEWEDDR